MTGKKNLFLNSPDTLTGMRANQYIRKTYRPVLSGTVRLVGGKCTSHVQFRVLCGVDPQDGFR
jgi:hypothetical protein